MCGTDHVVEAVYVWLYPAKPSLPDVPLVPEVPAVPAPPNVTLNVPDCAKGKNTFILFVSTDWIFDGITINPFVSYTSTEGYLWPKPWLNDHVADDINDCVFVTPETVIAFNANADVTA